MKIHPLWKNDRLGADSKFYTSKADVYDNFSQAEDAPKRVNKFYLPKIKDKVVLDFGCGTGKYIPEFALISKQYLAVDASQKQLEIAHKRALAFKNVTLCLSEEKSIPIASGSVDIVLANWVIGSIHDIQTRETIVRELKRVIKKEGIIYLTENYIGGEFKRLVDGKNGNKKTRIKNKWLKKAGFVRINNIKTYFEFENLNMARSIFTMIWGKRIAKNINSARIGHNVAIYENVE